MSSVSIVCRKDKLNQKGLAPIHFRIIKDRKISYIASGIMLPIEHWDFDKNKIKAKHTNSTRLNSFLTNKFAELQDQVFEHETVSKSLTTRQLRDKIYGKKPTDFFAFADEAIKRYLQDGKIGTHDKNVSIIAKLKTYVKGKPLAFQDITFDFLCKYESYLKAGYPISGDKVQKNSSNTVHKDFKFIRKLFNDAYRLEIIEHQVIPFNKYKMKAEKTDRTFLTEAEVLQIETYQPTPGTKMDLHKDMFVFACYLGLRISDMLLLQCKHFDGQNINFTVMKTKTQLSIKVPNKALAIIEKYRQPTAEKNTFIFPILPASLNLDDARELDTAISRATAYINKNLKYIAAKANIDKKISFHTSRHSFATRALTKGISIDKISKILGHAAIRETQVYSRIINKELDKAMEAFN